MTKGQRTMTTEDGYDDTIAYGKSAKRRKSAVIMELVKFTFDLMQTVSFMMFIEEEAIQIRGFGIMSLLRENLVGEVKTQVNALEAQCDNLETFVDGWGWAAPYMQQTYSNYVQATRDEIDAWKAWIISKEAEPSKEYGVRIVSRPSNAEIFIDGTNTQKLTPQTLYNLSPAPHTVKLKYYSAKHGDYIYEEEEIAVSQHETFEHRIVMKMNYTGLRVTSSPSGAEVKIDGHYTHQTTPHTFWLPPGPYQFKLTYYSASRGKLTCTVNTSVKEGEVRKERWILE